jgi:hypothetical protein
MNITVLLTHWPRHVDRFDYFTRTVNSLYKYLPRSTENHSFRFLAGIEHAMPGSSQLLDAAKLYCRCRHITAKFNTGEAGVGRNLNMLLEAVQTPYVLYFQDDFELTRPLPLDSDIRVLEGDNPYSVVRYAAHERTLKGAEKIQGDPLLLREIQPGAFYYWSFNPFLAKTDPLRSFFGPFPHERNAENLTNQKLRALPPHHRVLVRGPGPIRPPDCLVHHIGEKTSMIEKFTDEQLHGQFGLQIPPRQGAQK